MAYISSSTDGTIVSGTEDSDAFQSTQETATIRFTTARSLFITVPAMTQR